MTTLSVIIPAYNEELVLDILLKALAKQTLQPMEVIVADAHSTDRTREIALQAGVRVVDGGLPGVGRNRGAEVATGEWLLFLDADVVLSDEGFLERSLHEMAQRGLMIACPDVTATEDWRAKTLFAIYRLFTHAVERKYPHAVGACIFVKRELHERVSGFDETVLYAEDNEYGSRVAKEGRFGYLHETLFTPPRRFHRDGYVRYALMNVCAELHIRFLGPIRSDIFRYRFGYTQASEPSSDRRSGS